MDGVTALENAREAHNAAPVLILTAHAEVEDKIAGLGAGETISIKRTPVTNREYAAFVKATGHAAPSNWTNGASPAYAVNPA